jgi:hypothetical protein
VAVAAAAKAVAVAALPFCPLFGVKRKVRATARIKKINAPTRSKVSRLIVTRAGA